MPKQVTQGYPKPKVPASDERQLITVKAAQATQVEKHRTIEFDPDKPYINPGEPYIKRRAAQPKPVADHEQS
jgi:hypothetical protein